MTLAPLHLVGERLMLDPAGALVDMLRALVPPPSDEPARVALTLARQ